MKEQKTTKQWDGPVMVAEAHELLFQTQSGWVLLERFEEEGPETATVTKPDPNGNYPGSTTICEEVGQGRRSRFLLGFSQDAHVAELVKTAEVAQAANLEYRAKVAELEAAIEDLKREGERKDSAFQTADARMKRADQRFEQERQLRERLEGDLVRVKAHIGDKAWREALPDQGEG